MKTALASHGLTKVVDGQTLVRDVSLEIGTGETVGIVASTPGGATLVRLLATAIRPSAGSLLVAGIDAGRQLQAARRHIAYFPSAAFDRTPLRVDEWLWWIARGRSDDSTATIDHRVREAISSAGVSADRGVDTLSPNDRALLSAAAIACVPGHVILVGDPAWTEDADSARVANLLQALRERGTTIVMPLGADDADSARLCDRVLTVEAGRLAATRGAGGHEPGIQW